MSSLHTFDSAAAATAAVAGFLRGVERRAALLSELQCGDTGHGDQALAATIEAFSAAAPGAPTESWPHLFWSTLLQNPIINGEPVAPFWPGDFAPLARLDPGTRAVLLLRVVAGLDDAQASAVFGVEASEYKQALQRSLPQRPDGGLDGEAWLAMNDEARYLLKHMNPERVAAIARLRDAALATTAAAPAPAATRGALPLPRPRWLGKLWSGIALR
jgi:hypothetical protein